MSGFARTAASAALVAVSIGVTACGQSEQKPTKADVQRGLSTILVTAGGTANLVDPDQRITVSTCITDRIYDKVSTTTLKALATGNPEAKGDKNDKDVVKPAIKFCGTNAAANG